MRKMSVSLVAIVFFFGFGLQLAIADTEVSGDIDSDTTWTVAGSPYIVVDNVGVNGGVTLTIEPGVMVKFNDDKSLYIGGELIARGTATDNIFFTSNKFIPQPGDWESILFFENSADAVTDSLGNYVSGCIIEYSRIEYGKMAIHCYNASPFISHSAIVGNSAPWHGGGICCDDSSNPTIIHNTITGNFARDDGGGIYCSNYSNPTITHNTITGNYADAHGGGICCRGGNPTITHNTILGNSAWQGAGIYCSNPSNPTITHNTITGNYAELKGGGICCNVSNPTITHNTITGDSAGCYGSAICCIYSSPVITNCILWADGPDEIYVESGSPVVTHSDIQDTLWPGEGNISCDPKFCYPDTGNYYLAENSCCVGAGCDSLGNPDSTVDIGAFGIVCPPVSVEDPQDESTLPTEFSLSQNHPNPFNPITQIKYVLHKDCWVKLEVYNILGQKLVTLVDAKQKAGYKTASWDAGSLSSGIYFYRLKVIGDRLKVEKTRKMVLIR